MDSQPFTLSERTDQIRDRSSKLSTWESLRADRDVADHGKFEGVTRVLAALANPSLHAIFLLRLVSTSNSVVVRSLARRILITLHSSDISPDASIGPGLALVHPFGLAIGNATLGQNVALFQNVTIGQSRAGVPTIDDDVTIYAGSTVIGPVLIGRGATIGAGSYIDKDVAPGMVVAGGRTSVGPYQSSVPRQKF